MKLGKWLKHADLGGMRVAIFFVEDLSELPEFKGYVTDMPFGYSRFKLATSKDLIDNNIDSEAPIVYCTIDDKPGFQVYLKQREGLL